MLFHFFYHIHNRDALAVGEGVQAFAECSELSSVNIPNGLTNIGNSVFDMCGKITSITIPESVKTIGKYAFSSRKGLNYIKIPLGEYEEDKNKDALTTSAPWKIVFNDLLI